MQLCPSQDITNPGFLVPTTYTETRANVQMRVYGILRKWNGGFTYYEIYIIWIQVEQIQNKEEILY